MIARSHPAHHHSLAPLRARRKVGTSADEASPALRRLGPRRLALLLLELAGSLLTLAALLCPSLTAPRVAFLPRLGLWFTCVSTFVQRCSENCLSVGISTGRRVMASGNLVVLGEVVGIK